MTKTPPRRPRLALVPPAAKVADKSGQEARPAARGRPFQAGNRIGAAGRPRGARNAATVALEAIGKEHAADIMQTVVEQALGGDMTAARILLDRLWPAPKGRLVPLPLPLINNLEDLASAHAAVIAALATAQITIDEAGGLVAVLDHRRKLAETIEIEQRLTALERKMK